MDNHQYAYRKNKSTEDCVLTLVDSIIKHLENSNSYARALFIDYSSAFNTIRPSILIKKLLHLNIPPVLCSFILDFLISRRQHVKIDKIISSFLVCNIGSPQGCVLSAILYIIYTNDLLSLFADCLVFKYADDTVILGLISNDNEDHYRNQIEHTYSWCSDNNLLLNSKKTKELIFDFRKKHRTLLDPFIIDNSAVEVCENFKYLGVIIDNQLTWHDHVSYVVTKCNQQLFFLRLLRTFHVNSNILYRFFSAIIESIYKYNITVWYNSSYAYDKHRIGRIYRQSNKMVNETILPPRQLYDNIVCNKVVNIRKQTEGLFEYYAMRSGSRLRAISCRTQRYRKSFHPDSMHAFNSYL